MQQLKTFLIFLRTKDNLDIAYNIKAQTKFEAQLELKKILYFSHYYSIHTTKIVSIQEMDY